MNKKSEFKDLLKNTAYVLDHPDYIVTARYIRNMYWEIRHYGQDPLKVEDEVQTRYHLYPGDQSPELIN